MKKTVILSVLLLCCLSVLAQDSFYYWTDCHYPQNSGRLPEQIRELSAGEKNVKIIFGGDATANETPDVFRKSMDSFREELSKLRSFATLYLTRGNHDYQTKNDLSLTMDNKQTASFIRSEMNGKVIRNAADRTGNYWYFDNRKARIRYIAMDSTDSVQESTVKYGFGDTQLEWIFKKAMMGTPAGYGVVLFFHAPVCPDNSTTEYGVRICDALEAFAAARNFVWKDEVIPFSRLKNVKLLYVQNGHRHMDYAQYHNGVLHVLTAADTRGFSSKSNVFDKVTVSADFSSIDMVRCGKVLGTDRHFNLKPIVLEKGSSVKLNSGLEGCWNVKDGAGNYFIRENKKGERKGDPGWHYKNNIASISSDGTIVAKERGDAMAWISTADKEEYFMIIVK